MPLYRSLARLPLGIWLRLIALAFAAAALLAFGVAVIAVAAIALAVGVLIYKARAWFSGLFDAAATMAGGSPRPVPARVQRARATDAEYTIIEHR
jgi:hypothetical protein